MSKLEFIPAIDLLDGNVVRLYKGRYDDSTKYDDDPVIPVERFVTAGARLIHLVDLNAARNGDRNINRNAIQKIREATKAKGVRLEIGGGVRNLGVVKDYLEAGVDRVIIGTAAVKEPEFLISAIQEFGAERIIVGVDALNGKVRVSGWEENSELLVEDFIDTLIGQGVAEIVFTDIARDGALTGPATEAMIKLLDRFTIRMIASGGISSLADLELLKPLQAKGLVGVISGKAIYEDKFDVKQAIQICDN